MNKKFFVVVLWRKNIINILKVFYGLFSTVEICKNPTSLAPM
jgi:hypothetical protein